MTKAVDMYTGAKVVRPTPTPPRLKYDFDFTKDGKWYYINSVDNPDDPSMDGQKEAVTSQGQRWRVVEAATGKMVRKSPKEKP